MGKSSVNNNQSIIVENIEKEILERDKDNSNTSKTIELLKIDQSNTFSSNLKLNEEKEINDYSTIEESSKSKSMQEIGKSPLKKSLFSNKITKFSNSSDLNKYQLISQTPVGKITQSSQTSSEIVESNKFLSVQTINEFENSEDNLMEVPIHTEIVSTGVN